MTKMNGTLVTGCDFNKLLVPLTVWLKKSWVERFSALFSSQQIIFGSRLIPKHVWVYYCILLLFNFSGVAGWGWGQVVGKSDFNENPVVSLDLDFGLRLRVCQHTT